MQKNGFIKTKHQYHPFIQKLKQNNLSFLIDKLDLTSLPRSLSNKRTKLIEQARSILNAAQLQTFESIINNISIKPIKAPKKPPKPPKPSQPTPETTVSKPINPLSPVTTLPLPSISMSTSSSPNNNNQTTTNNTNNNTNNKPQSILGASTSNVPLLSAILFKDMVNASTTPEILLQNALKTISDAYTKHINDIHNQFKQQQRTTSLAIQQIDEKMNALYSQKKELKSYISNHTKDMNHKLYEMEAHKDYITAVHNKYRTALQSNYSFGNDLIDNQQNNLMCKHCGHLSKDYMELNDHLSVHKDDIPKLSANEWKTALVDVIACYQSQMEAFTAPQMLQKPLFPPKPNGNISDTLNVMGGMTHNIINYDTNNIINSNHNHNQKPLPIPPFNVPINTANTIDNVDKTNIKILGANIDDMNWINSNSKKPEIVDITDGADNPSESDDHNLYRNINGSVINKKRKRMLSTSNHQQQKKRKTIPTLIDITNDNDDIHSINAINIYPKHLDLQFVLKFDENQLIDYRDFNARYLQAKIMQIEFDYSRNHAKFGIHYIGWDNKWNVWSIPKYQHRRYSMHGSVSRRALHRACMRYVSMEKPWGDYVEVRPLHLHEHTLFKLHHQPNDTNVDRHYVDKYLRWHVAQVVLSDSYSAQVQVVLLIQNEYGEWYKPRPKADLYWVHLDNEEECAPSNRYIINPKIRHTAQKKRTI